MGFTQPFQQYIRGQTWHEKTTYGTWGFCGFGAAAPGKALPCATFSHVDGQGHAPFRADRDDAARGSLGAHCGSLELPTQMEVARGTGHQCAGILADTHEWIFHSGAGMSCRFEPWSMPLWWMRMQERSLGRLGLTWLKTEVPYGAFSILRIFAPFLLSLHPVSLGKKNQVFFVSDGHCRCAMANLRHPSAEHFRALKEILLASDTNRLVAELTFAPMADIGRQMQTTSDNIYWDWILWTMNCQLQGGCSQEPVHADYHES